MKLNFVLLICVSIVCCSPNEKNANLKESNLNSVLTPGIDDKDIPKNKKLELLDEYLKVNKNTDSLYLNALWKKSNLHYSLKNYDSVIFYDRLLLEKSVEGGNLFYQAKANGNMAFDYRELQVYDSAFYYFQKSKSIYQILKDSTQIGRKLLEMAKIQNRQNDFFGSKESITEALIFFDIKKNPRYIASAFNELGSNHNKLFNRNYAEEYYEKAIKLAPTSEIESIYKNNLATLYIGNSEFDKAIEILKEIVSKKTLDKKSSQYARILHNLTYAKWRNGENNQPLAVFRALKIRKNGNDMRGQISSYTDLGEYFSITNPEKASKYLDSVIQLSKKLRIPRAETDALNLLMQLEPKNTVFKDRYIFLKDSLYEQELKVKTQFAKMRYDDQQEKEQILRLEAESLEKKAELAEEKTEKVVLLSLSGLLLLGGVSLFYLLRQRFRKEKLQEVYRTEKKISQRLHDELSNDIFGLMANVEQRPDENTIYVLDSLEKIYQHTRNISHDNREIALGEEFATELKDLLGAFYNTQTTVIVKDLESIVWEKLSDEKCVAVHRCLKELMVNMKKHSQASLVAIHFEQRKKELDISYSDNGIGIDPQEKFGVGLKNTVSRIQSVQGKINFDSNPGNGTKISIVLPF